MNCYRFVTKRCFGPPSRHHLFGLRAHFSSSKQVVQSFQDPVLEWARANPKEAERCLQVPPWTMEHCDPALEDSKTASFEAYLRWRRWPYAEPEIDLHSNAVSLASHLLSSPLTLANFRAQLCDDDTRGNLCCVGARAEATVPIDMWKEFLLLTSVITDRPMETRLDFVGPDVMPKTKDTSVSLDDSRIALRWLYRGYLHELIQEHDENMWEAYVFLNPGFGHPHLRDGWRPSLEQVLPSRKPCLLTAHSEEDAERDFAYLSEFGIKPEYKLNPFASRIKYQDPFDASHFVSPNKYVAMLSVEE